EQCDDGNTEDGDGCDSECQLEEEFCGDNIPQADLGEQCDYGNIDCDECTPPYNGDLCTAEYGEECTYCSNGCEEVTLAGGYCGDGTPDPGEEECDDGINNGIVCDPPYDGECQYCSNSCEIVTVESNPGYDVCDDIDCPAGYYCDPNTEECISVECVDLWDCAACHRCEYGECIPDTSSSPLNDDCPEGYHCDDGACIEDEVCSTCQRRDDNYICRNITTACGEADDCAQGSSNYRCDNGNCVSCENCIGGDCDIDGECVECNKRCAIRADGKCFSEYDTSCEHLCFDYCGNTICNNDSENCGTCSVDCECNADACEECSNGECVVSCDTDNCYECFRGVCTQQCATGECYSCDGAGNCDYQCSGSTPYCVGGDCVECIQGSCGTGDCLTCSSGQCVSTCSSSQYCDGNDNCLPCPTCDSLNYDCGSRSTPCGTLNCGECTPFSCLICEYGQCVSECDDNEYCDGFDCQPNCGNGTCGSGEDCSTCPADCGECCTPGDYYSKTYCEEDCGGGTCASYYDPLYSTVRWECSCP
ncbi:MAG: hypothetical protein P9L98_05760, partial [Candidatus Kaelpia imicola]|nr:hypothetical protein [Candidatus Kaelpia imicola]